MNKYVPSKRKTSKKNWFDDIAKANGIREPQKSDIVNLAIMFPDLKIEIEAKNSYTLTVSLVQLSVICPKKEKKRRAYQPLVSALDKLNIALHIS